MYWRQATTSMRSRLKTERHSSLPQAASVTVQCNQIALIDSFLCADVDCAHCPLLLLPASRSGLSVAALGNGLCFAALIYCTAGISGGHLNPAITTAMYVTKRCAPFSLHLDLRFLRASHT